MGRIFRVSAVAAGVLLALPTVASAQLHAYGQAAPTEVQFVLIANLANRANALDRGEASKLFLGKRAKWPSGAPVQPVDLVESSPVRRRFSNEILGMGVQNVKSYWQEMVFAGRGNAPPERATDAEVIEFVKANPNAVGYIGAMTPSDGVKILGIK
jgi:ABC-type phosphate transport system substrate-binding protein